MKEENTLPLPFRGKTQRGTVKGKSCIAYSLNLPSLAGESFDETEKFLKMLGENYLAFLRKESEKACEYVRFAGLSWDQNENRITLLAALCPFSERAYRPVATLVFDEKGALLDVQREKRSRQKP